MTRWLFLTLCVVSLAGCRSATSPAGAPPRPGGSSAKAAGAEKAGTAAATKAPSGDAVAAGTAAPDAGVPGAATAAPDAGTALDPDHFVGFSGDEREFAWSSYSDGAGFYILTVVASTTGARVTDLPLDSPEAKAKARSLLAKQRFTATPVPASKALPAGTTLKVTVPDGMVTVALVRGDRAVALKPGKDFLETSKHFGAPKAALWGFSPQGTYVAVKLTQSAGAELGTAVAYHVVDVKAGLKRLDAAPAK